MQKVRIKVLNVPTFPILYSKLYAADKVTIIVYANWG